MTRFSALGGLAGLLVWDAFRPLDSSSATSGRLIGLLAVCELAGTGTRSCKWCPVEMFLGVDPVSDAIKRLEADSAQPARCESRRETTSTAICGRRGTGFEKTNVNDVFQIDHAAKLYERLYPVAAHRRGSTMMTMNDAVEDFNREVRQAVFDRMSVSHVVSDRFESDPGWPVAASGNWNGRRVCHSVQPRAIAARLRCPFRASRCA